MHEVSAMMFTNSSVATSNDVGIRGLDYLEFYVGNPRQAAHFYRTTFGLPSTGVGGLETGLRDRCSFVASSGDVRFVLTGAVSPLGPIAEHLQNHGEGVRDIAFRVSDVESTFHAALIRGARAVEEPRVYRAGNRTVVRASIAAFGDVVHSFVQRDSGDWFLPGFDPIRGASDSGATVASIDHLAISLAPGTLEEYVEFYKNVLGFEESHQEYVQTAHSSMNSKVVQSPDGRIRLPLLEPIPGKNKSQVAEYLEYHRGPGVQHAALHSDDIIRTVTALRARGIDFLTAPSAYYEMLSDRVGSLEEDVRALRDLNILVDKDGWGYLMQIFSKPLQSRPTFFVEVIQRRGARGFGSGNIRALFEAVEHEQRRRGNL
jgi:4-hydroxyphenylpyruvate dioxygenase